mmetsp:Transcript_70640/g.187763  ORF Transcript_70640/g.187763 Transcript_70640/m.187763 type:complete len:81 (+) Transcript_70640:67-309(+)
MSIQPAQEDQLALRQEEQHRRETLNSLASRARMINSDNYTWLVNRGMMGGAQRLPTSGQGESTAFFDGKSLVVRKPYFTS